MTSPRRALVVVDVQQEYFSGPLTIQHPAPADALANVVRAVETARAHDVPIVLVQHAMPAGAPIFAAGSPGFDLHPDLLTVTDPRDERISKSFGSVFAGTGLADRLRERDVDTVTIVGFMTNNCDLASAVEAEGLGFSAEVLSDASGAIDLDNAVGHVPASVLHETLMVLLHSNFAAVATTQQWVEAVAGAQPLPLDNLVDSAVRGRARVGG
ncbi:isochorismatase family protein [Kineococcus sp. NBC_00420]|uniref:isochorismatase family protein n=1 Tax=Kineococcus sp. NBC_00420 TaxID=2903564 RepID=UPI002E2260E7